MRKKTAHKNTVRVRCMTANIAVPPTLWSRSISRRGGERGCGHVTGVWEKTAPARDESYQLVVSHKALRGGGGSC